MNINFEVFFIKSKPYLYTLFIVILLVNTLSSINRWDLLEQISMADNFINNGYLYPNISEPITPGASPYFPGMALLALLFNKIGFDYYLVEIMLIFSLFIFIYFVFVQTKIINMITNHKYDFNDIFPFAIVFIFLICPSYYKYAIEGKPDTISFLLGYLGLFYYIKSNNKINYNFFIAIILVGIPILFKQQYVSFLLGLFLFCIFNINKNRILFFFSSVTISISILFILYELETPWYWNVTSLADDGFLQIKEIIINNMRMGYYFLVFIILLILILSKNSLMNITMKILNKNKLKLLLRNPWIYITTIAIIVSFLSSFKYGGNSGNVEFGLFLLFPLFFLISNIAPKYKMIALAWFVLLPHCKDLSLFNNYLKASQMKSYVAQLDIDPDSKILTGSNSYFASRLLLKKGIEIDNYWTSSMKKNSSVYEELSNSIKIKDYKILIVENWPENLIQIESSNNYEIVFKNTTGIVAKKIIK